MRTAIEPVVKGLAPAHLIALGMLALGACQEAPAPALFGADTQITLRDHPELIVDGEGGVRPLHLGGERPPPQVCLAPPASVDTSRWQARLHLSGQAPPEQYRAPSTRLGATLCFEGDQLHWGEGGETALCGELIDRYDGARQTLPCQPLTFRVEIPARSTLLVELNDILRASPAAETQVTVQRLSDLQQRAQPYPLLQTRIRLVASFFARRSGNPTLLAAARRELAQTPDWLSSPPALVWFAQWRYEEATLALTQPVDLRTAWVHLREAERAYRTIADPKAITTAMKRSEVLTRLGNAREATLRLDAALTECGTANCEPRLLPAARTTLAWSMLMQPDLNATALARVHSILMTALEGQPEDAPLERANVLVNMALHAVRAGESPAQYLGEATTLLEQSGGREQARAAGLREWADLVVALDALGAGRLDAAQAQAQSLAGVASQARVAAWAFSLLGQIAHQREELDAAADAFEAALLLHRRRDTSDDTPSTSTPGQWADDVYRTARVAVERKRLAEAWALLAGLDGVATPHPCTGEAGADDTRYAALLAELAALQTPASRTRRQQRQGARRALLDELQQIMGESCVHNAPTPPIAAHWRAVALPDEVLLLSRSDDGEVTLHRRTPYVRTKLREDLEQVEAAMVDGVDDRTWRALTAHLGAALVPTPTSDPSAAPTRFALHGPLQRAPLAALPLGSGWLADQTTVVLQAAGLQRPAQDSTAADRSAALFVVNPTADLAAAATAAPRYRQWFPQALVLNEDEARYDQVVQALGRASLVHVDAHATYDPAFPGLSQIRLAGKRGLLAQDLARGDARYRLVNLSACESGRWPVTAGSGLYGMGGVVVRRNADWVIAARAPLADEVASALNDRFYPRLRDGATPPAAYRAAHASVRSAYRASHWAPLMLLGGAGGQTGAPRTPEAKVGGGTIE